MKSFVSVLGANEQERVQNWYRAAMNDPRIARWLSTSQYIEVPEISSTNWTRTVLMHSSNTGIATLYPERGGNRRAGVSLYVLPNGTPSLQRMIAGKLMLAVKEQALRQGVKWLDWYVHDRNLKCLRLSERHGASHFSVQPEGAWDSWLREWTDLHGFTFKIGT